MQKCLGFGKSISRHASNEWAIRIFTECPIHSIMVANVVAIFSEDGKESPKNPRRIEL